MRGNTVLAEHADGGVLRIDEPTGRGIAVSTDASGRYTQLDPYTGAQLALAEAYRNVAVTGATPVAVTNCLNFGSPEDPGVMWQFARRSAGSPMAVRPLAFRSPAATSASTTRPAPPRSCRPRWSVCSA